MPLEGGVLEVHSLFIAALPAQTALMAYRQTGFDIVLVHTGCRFQQHKQLAQLFI